MWMSKRLQYLGIVLAVIGLGFVFGGGYAYLQVQDGYESLHAFSEAENVTLSYNEDGQLVDRGTTEGADAIMQLLTAPAEDGGWAYPIIQHDLDPNDPLVNTATEYMFQMATIVYHTLHSTVTVTLPEEVTYDGTVYPAGDYDVAVEGKYWSDFDRNHPLEGPARALAWSGTAHALIGTLGVGTMTASTLQLAQAVSFILIGLGFTLLILGGGLFWSGRAREEVFAVDIEDRAPQPTSV
jgi:hypothetical protein